MTEIQESEQALLRSAYAYFNQRDMEMVLRCMHEDVDWENGATGERIPGRAALREYWAQQWAAIDPHVDPVGFHKLPDGRILVSVHQVVKELDGTLLMDRLVEHTYTLENGLIRKMEIRSSR